ncbi:MAG: PaaI family thioesterase [Propionibacteriaceae bacterium]|jgi:acyl-coenzyme A thioesterase PaaI-like protein|nr:PaaI family thioesterase [Propionibacteriaceae bacterium]
MMAFQDRYPDKYAHCFGCGPLNAEGWAIKSYWDEAAPGESVAVVTLGAQYTGGWPEAAYGGAIASLLDCHSAGTASATRARAAGLPDDGPVPRCVTASLKVDFLKPTPLNGPLEVRAKVRSMEGRKVTLDAWIVANGDTTARAEALMVEIP